MTPFLLQIAQYVFQNHKQETEHITIVLPNKRGALYFKQHLASVFRQNIWLPTIISVEDLIGQLSGLKQADNIDLICDLYSAYKLVLKEKSESFDHFVKWGSLMLQDFNEADRYLVDTKSLYKNLKEIKEIENWSLSSESLTDTQRDYCEFMNQMGEIHEAFSKILLDKKIGYQGLIYRHAVLNFKQSDYIRSFSKILICGFNALNASETIIFSDLVKEGKATMLWDADHYYLDNKSYEAGLFLRKNFSNRWFEKHNEIGNYFRDIPKHIEVVAVPRQVGQAQVVSYQLSKWINEGKSLNKIAIVLADESLLLPVLSQLPKEVEHVNITMEYPLRLTPIYDLADQLIQLHCSIQKSDSLGNFYFSDLFKIFENSLFKQYYLCFEPSVKLQAVTQQIIEKNYVWLSQKNLQQLFQTDYQYIAYFFEPWKDSVNGINTISRFLRFFNESDLVPISNTDREHLHVFTKYFNRLQDIIQTHDYLNSLITLKSLFKQIIGSSSVPFIGEPLQGIQIMGVLETRTLDFEHVMVLGVNEGILPSGKTVSSFIPNDLKRYHQMPLYSDKDAVYAYHFYRLLQRSSDVLITYNTEQTVFGSGEKSRFITQLEFELSKSNSEHTISEKILSGAHLPPGNKKVIQISKTNENINPIIKKITGNDEYSGLSPSALIAFIDCPLRFYFRYGAGIKETDEIEENAEANTQGTILHKVLELLYQPFIGTVLTEAMLKQAREKTKDIVTQVFDNYFTQTESRFGKNFLQKKIISQYADKLLRADIKLIKHTLREKKSFYLKGLEKKLTANLNVPINGVNIIVQVQGTADRIDKVENQLRIIDYKSSINSEDKFKFKGFDILFSDSRYSKMLQLMMYAWLVYKNNMAEPEDIYPCIIPFRKFEEHPRFILTDDKHSSKFIFSEERLLEFEEHLIRKIGDILNPVTAFYQTNDNDSCEYCAYKAICNVH